MGTFLEKMWALFSRQPSGRKQRRKGRAGVAATRVGVPASTDSEPQGVAGGIENTQGGSGEVPKEYPMTPERAELIRQAKDILQAKQKMIESLPEPQRHKLALLAHLMLSIQSRQDKSEKS